MSFGIFVFSCKLFCKISICIPLFFSLTLLFSFISWPSSLYLSHSQLHYTFSVSIEISGLTYLYQLINYLKFCCVFLSSVAFLFKIYFARIRCNLLLTLPSCCRFVFQNTWNRFNTFNDLFQYYRRFRIRFNMFFQSLEY